MEENESKKSRKQMAEGKYETQKNFGRNIGKQTQKETVCKESGDRRKRKCGTAGKEIRKEKETIIFIF
jgi:hypothetical protein